MLKYKIVKTIAEHAPKKLIVLLLKFHRKLNKNKTTEEVFSQIYSKGLWGGKPGEFFSGTGSTGSHAQKYCDLINNFIISLKKKDLRAVDLGCGDFRIGEKIAKNDIKYVGLDVVPELIKRNKEKFPNVEFKCLDIANEELPEGDICFIRQVLQHLSNDQIKQILQKVAKYKYVFITEHYHTNDSNCTPNKDKPQGADTRLYENSAVYLDKEPFNLTNIELVLKCPVSNKEELRTFLIRN